MKLIKHLINIAFLWSLPYVGLMLFWLLTFCQFSYKAVLVDGTWIGFVLVFWFIALLLYTISLDSEDEITLFNKTNK